MLSRRRVLRAIASIAGLYALVVLLAAVGYRRLLYPAPRTRDLTVPRGAELWTLRADDGAPVHAVFFPAPPSAPVVVYLHGNGETLADEMPLADRLAARGVGVAVVEYRGYGVSRDGSPTEAGLYADARAVIDELGRRGVGADRVALWGFSLGTGVAAQMATTHAVRALVLVAPYTSIPDVGARWMPWLPARWLVADRFATIEKAPNIRAPTLVVHGDADEVVPFDMGRDVARAAHARFVPIAGGHHMDLLARDPALLDDILGFVRAPAR